MPTPVTHPIEEGFVVQFRDGIRHRAEQRDSRFRSRCRVESGITGTRASFDYLQATEPTKRVARHADTVLSDISQDRRWVELEVWDDAKLIDKPDKIRTLSDPTNPYSVALSRGMGRRIDRSAIAGATGLVRVGGSDTTPAASTSALPASQIIGGAAVPPDVDIYLQAMEKMNAAEEDEMGRTIFWGSNQVRKMLGVTQVTSIDYNSVRALTMGQLTEYLGASWVRSELLEKVGNLRRNLAIQREALLIGFGMDVQARITERDDKNFATQVWYSMDFGAARMQDTGIVRIDIDETA